MIQRLNPVSLPSGAHQETQDEFVFSSHPSFAIVRTLDTAQEFSLPLGTLHRTNLDDCIRDGEDGEYNYFDLTGIPVSFKKPEPHPGTRESNTGHKHLALEPLPRSGLRLHNTKARTLTTFRKFAERVWYPVEIQDASGLSIKIERSREGYVERLLHPGGVALEFRNDADGRRSGFDVVGLDGSRLSAMQYGYDAEGRLVSASSAHAKSWTYAYGDGSITSDDGQKTRTIHHFDDQGRVTAVDTGGSYKHGQIEYDDDRGQVTVTHGASDDTTFEKFWFDAEKRGFMSANPLGEISYRQFDDDHQLTAEIDANGNQKSYRYDTYGNVSSNIDGEGRENFTAFDDAGNVLVSKAPDGSAWRYDYDDGGQLVEVKDPLGHLTNIINNEVGQPLQIMRHDGLIEFRNYDNHNRLDSVIDYNSAETRFAYDAFNRLTGIMDAAGSVTRLAYDEIDGRPFDVPSLIVRPDGVEIRRDFHPTGSVKSLTDGEGRVTRYGYGAYDVLESITDPKGNTLEFAYDSQERLTEVTNQLGLKWTFERDQAGRVTRETDFDGRELQYRYDPGGRVIRRDNPDGGYLEYDYDRSALMTEMRAFEPGSRMPVITTYTYDENGALATASNPSANISLERDKLGRVIAETTNGVRIESEIDCCGRRIKRTMGDQIIAMAYDGMGALTQWHLNGHDPLQFERSAVGLETRRHSQRGFDLKQGWDVLGQMEWQSDGRAEGKFGRSYAWSDGFDPRAINDAIWGEKHYEYDQNGQITRTHHGDGKTERFGYNADLNLSASGDVVQFQNWQTSAAGVVRLARGPKGEIVKQEHDANGRIVKRTIERVGFRPQTWNFEWNALDQMVCARCPGGDVWTYAYDPFGRRISKANQSEDHRFIWDGDVIAREIRNGQDIDWFFEPGTFRPMARCADGVLTNIVTDHLGTPKEMVTEGGTLVWAADHDTWGSVRRHWTPRNGASQVAEAPDMWAVEIPAQDFQQDDEPLLCPIRFQGQWEDPETGLFYNRYRYYDPLSGNYACADPIGLFGGMRSTAYVGAPSRGIDPKGLCCGCWRGEPGEYNYRGVNPDHPAYQDALQGRVAGGTNMDISPEMHNFDSATYAGDSPFTSWTRDPAVAERFAGPDGVILRVPTGAPGENDGWNWEYSPDQYGESEILLQGVREGIEVFDRRGC